MLNDLSEIIAIESVEAERSAADAPFGQGLRNALDWFLNKASSYGFKVGENGGYYGWADYGDPGAPIIGIPAHIDIVPVGPGWKSDPLTLRIENGRAYGRGVADDKGPLVVALHTLKRIRDEKIKLRHRVRLIVGCNEESGSACLKKYAAEDEIPVMSIVPDAEFPVINSEKGILHLRADISVDEVFRRGVLALDAGERVNIVTPLATARLAHFSDIPSVDGVSVDENGAVTAVGVAGHASTPEKGENALWKMFELLYALMPESETAKNIYCRLCRADALQAIGAFCEDRESGALTVNIGMARYADGVLSLYFDLRVPLCADIDEIEKRIGEAIAGESAALSVKVERLNFSENLFVSATDPMIKALLKVYSRVTGEKSPKPLQIGGGTYARELPNAVAFGPAFPGEQTNMHNIDENIAVADLERAAEIYYQAILELDKL